MLFSEMDILCGLLSMWSAFIILYVYASLKKGGMIKIDQWALMLLLTLAFLIPIISLGVMKFYLV